MTSARPACCVLFTTDSSYLFPTLIGAMQARRHSSPDKADVTIFCVDLEPEADAIFRPICEKEGVGLQSIASATIEGQTAMMARLFLNRFVPPEYTQYLYMDGDIQVHASLDPLIDAEVPPGHFMASNDVMTFLLQDRGRLSRDLRAHMQSLDLTDAEALRYFNSGVLRIAREGWGELGEQAWKYFQHSGTNRRFPDQDALNVVGQHRRLPMPIAWNYPVFLNNARVVEQVQPRVVHFMSSPKPWEGAFAPWTRAECEPYREAIRAYPRLRKYQQGMSLRRRSVYRLQQQVKRCIETVSWGLSARRQRLLDYESSCALLPGMNARVESANKP